MVDSDEFIVTSEGGSLSSIKFGELVSRMSTSYLLAFFAGVATLAYSIFEVPALLLEDFFTWIRGTVGLGFIVPRESIEYAWEAAADIFPIAGPFDYALGVLLVMMFFLGVNWMFSRVRRGL